MELANFEALFGEPKVESSTPVHPFLFQFHAPDPSQLRVDVTDFFSTSFEAIRSIQQLDDMRDETGVGGSWSDFLEYLVTSIKFGDVKLVFEGSESARLIAQKSKGMPRISVSLHRLVGTAANEAMARLSLHIYKSYKSNHKLLVEEQEGRHQLTKMLSAEQEKNKQLQQQLDELLYSNRRKSQKTHDKLTSATSSAAALYDSSDKQSDQNPSPMKAPNRVVPAHRRSKVRGVLLQDTEDD
ncbi:hypothetical protein L1987_78674 [Smallanthus sonchifolius]|uniref:Uncharacterized protein n=1 Tax=Smallanthus sonchifolius TaxID=185202 RepID=A0ACB8ZDB2_9ASTR|nr:hypothetical protein L1987_78674 [Smallanthus sonchifolius]